jgi:hypothetical protein
LPFGGLQKARTLEITLPLPEKSVFFEVPVNYKRAEYTIDILGLNRDFIVAGRRNAALDFKARLYEYEQEKPRLSPQDLDQFKRDFQQHSYPKLLVI